VQNLLTSWNCLLIHIKILHYILDDTPSKIIYSSAATFWPFPLLPWYTENFIKVSLALLSDFLYGALRNLKYFAALSVALLTGINKFLF
jgi:hypothetical protein